MKASYRLFLIAAILAASGCAPDRQDAAEVPAKAEAAEPMKPDVPLTNTYWKLVELNGTAAGPGEGKEPHMILRGEDQVGGYAGCNQFTGSLTISGDGLAFGPIASTRRMCPDVMQQEDAFLQALESAHRFEISGSDLAVLNAAGEVVMRFAAVFMQ